MKLQSNNLLETLTSNEIKSLAIQVKETVCKNFVTQRKRTFTAADLWNIQRRKRNLMTRKLSF
jgi:hypothetical protein